MKNIYKLFAFFIIIVLCLANVFCTSPNGQSSESLLESQIEKESSFEEESKKEEVQHTRTLTKEDIDDLTEEKWIDYFYHGQEFPNDFIPEELLVYDSISRSVEDAESAVEQILEFQKQFRKTIISCEVVLETDDYYGVLLTWDASGQYCEQYILCFKSDLFQLGEFVEGRYALSFGNIEMQKMKQILDVYCYTNYKHLGYYKVCFSEIEEGEDFVYSIYVLEPNLFDPMRPDFSSSATPKLVKKQMIINKEDGSVSICEDVVLFSGYVDRVDYYLFDGIYSSQENYYKGVDLEKLTDEELFVAFNNNPKFPEGFSLYGKENYTRIFKSATSRENAQAQITDWIENDTYKVTHCLYIEERQTYYGFYVRWENRQNPNENYQEKIMCFKFEVFQFTSGYHSFTGEECFGDTSIESIQAILNQCYYSFFYSVYNYSVCISFVEQAEDIVYTLYYLCYMPGDWGVMNSLSLNKIIVTIDDQTGKFISIEEEVVRGFYLE